MENLTEMWAKSLRNLPDSSGEIKVQYLYLKRRKIEGVCNGQYLSEFIGNTHPSKKIKATVKTTSWYQGRIVGESTKEITVKPGVDNEMELGCTGWANPTGADTEYIRKVTYAEWG